MTCDELRPLIPDLVNNTLEPQVLAEVEATLPSCPDCQMELENARQVRALLQRLQLENVQLRLPAGFEVRLLARLGRHNVGRELLDFGSKSVGLWLVELLNLLGGVFGPAQARGAGVRVGGQTSKSKSARVG